MLLPQPHVVGDVVARGYHLRVPLRSPNCGSCNPQGKKYTTIHQKACHHDKSSAVISRSAPTRHVRANAADQGHPSLPQDTPDTPSTFDCVGGVHWCPQRPASHHRKICRFFYHHHSATVPAPSHRSEQPQATGAPQQLIIDVSLFRNRLVAIVQGPAR